MIIDHSRMISGTSVSRMSDYLSLCKMDLLVRKADSSAPSRRVDQPSKVGQAGTMARPISSVRPKVTMRIDYNRKLGDRNLTLEFKRRLSLQSGLNIESLTEAGTVILQQDNKDSVQLPYYKVVTCADNFATQRKEWRVCLVFEKQDHWVNAFLTMSRATRLPIDYLFDVIGGKIKYHKV